MFQIKMDNKHTVINKKKLVFTGKAINLFGKYILWCFLTIITFGIYGWWLEIKMLKWQSKNIHIKTVGEQEAKDNSLWIAIPIAILAILAFSFVVAAAGTFMEENDIHGNIDFTVKGIHMDLNSKTNSDSSRRIKTETQNAINEYNY